MRMNSGLQKNRIDKRLEEEGFTDVDSEAMIDDSLRFNENKKNIEEKTGISLTKDNPRSGREARQRDTAGQKKQAELRNSQRTEASLEADKSKQADTVFDFPLEDDEFEEWAEDPNEFDIEGIDTKI